MPGVIVAFIGLLGLLPMASPASAHGGDESAEGYLLVQQALGYLADDTGQEGVDLAMEKVDDALAAEDQDGVEVADVEGAKQALDARLVEDARALLQSSIEGALSELAPAKGEETGTTVVSPALAGRQSLTGLDWALVAASVVLLMAGAGLAFRFRPSDSVSDLRRRLRPTDTVVVGAGNRISDESDL